MGRKLQRGFSAYDRGLEDDLRASRFCNVVAAAVVGAGATVYSASKASSAQNKASNIAKEQGDRQAAIAERQVAMAEDQYDRYKTMYGPAEEAFIQEAQGFGSQANQERVALKAASDAEAASGVAKKKFEENLTSLGVNPNDSRYANTMAGMELQTAATKAGSMSGARDKVRDLGIAMQKDVVSLGKGMPSSSASMLSSAASTMGTAANGQIAAMNNQANGWSQAVGGLGGITGSILKSDAFQDWWNKPSAGSGIVVPTSGDFGSNIIST